MMMKEDDGDDDDWKDQVPKIATPPPLCKQQICVLFL